jgi:hypothetical protein
MKRLLVHLIIACLICVPALAHASFMSADAGTGCYVSSKESKSNSQAKDTQESHACCACNHVTNLPHQDAGHHVLGSRETFPHFETLLIETSAPPPLLKPPAIG